MVSATYPKLKKVVILLLASTGLPSLNQSTFMVWSPIGSRRASKWAKPPSRTLGWEKNEICLNTINHIYFKWRKIYFFQYCTVDRITFDYSKGNLICDQKCCPKHNSRFDKKKSQWRKTIFAFVKKNSKTFTWSLIGVLNSGGEVGSTMDSDLYVQINNEPNPPTLICW